MEQKGFRQKMIASIDIDELEGIFLEKYRERLRDTKRFENYEERLVGQEQQITNSIVGLPSTTDKFQ